MEHPHRPVFDDRPDPGIRNLLRAVCVHVHRLGAAQHGPEPRRSLRGGGGKRVLDVVQRDLPPYCPGHHFEHAAFLRGDARHLRRAGGARQPGRPHRAHHLHLQAHCVEPAALQHRSCGRDHPHDGHRGAGLVAAESPFRPQLRDRGRQGVPAAQPRSRAVALVHLRAGDDLPGGGCGAAHPGALHRGISQVHVHPQPRGPVRVAPVFARALLQHLRQPADAAFHLEHDESRNADCRGRRRARLFDRLHRASHTDHRTQRDRPAGDAAGGGSRPGHRRGLSLGLDRRSGGAVRDDLDSCPRIRGAVHA